jgi:hypothetical protein
VRGPDGCHGLKNCAEDTSVSSSSFSGGAGHGLLRKTEAGTPFNKTHHGGGLSFSCRLAAEGMVAASLAVERERTEKGIDDPRDYIPFSAAAAMASHAKQPSETRPDLSVGATACCA